MCREPGESNPTINYEQSTIPTVNLTVSIPRGHTQTDLHSIYLYQEVTQTDLHSLYLYHEVPHRQIYTIYIYTKRSHTDRSTQYISIPLDHALDRSTQYISIPWGHTQTDLYTLYLYQEVTYRLIYTMYINSWFGSKVHRSRPLPSCTLLYVLSHVLFLRWAGDCTFFLFCNISPWYEPVFLCVFSGGHDVNRGVIAVWRYETLKGILLSETWIELIIAHG